MLQCKRSYVKKEIIMKILFSALFFLSLEGMNDPYSPLDNSPSTFIEVREATEHSNHELNHETSDEDLTRITLCLSEKSLRNGIGKKMEELVKKRLRNIRAGSNPIIRDSIHELEGLKDHLQDEEQKKVLRKKIIKNNCLYDVVNQVVGESFEEYEQLQREELELYKQISRRNEIQKWVAVAVSIFCALIGAGSSLLVNFTKH